ncbi:hypothetical protein ABZ023_06030 [Streptomyces sp. NPDC006367]|uniref:hypothetical protein n=1 Tax=unclassified Streptomyces TaxID=2593676 RepID=UPI0033B89DDF
MLRAFLRTSRPAAAPPPAGDDADVLLDAPDDRLAPALVAAARGEYGPASVLLASTRENAQWERRDRYAARLAAFARSRSAWLEHWRAAAPADPDALLVAARLTVDRCWESPARAELLRQAGPVVVAATDAGGPDPVPWRVALDTARGAHAGHAEFERLWEQAVRRSPHHYGCHVAALEYLAAASPRAHRECLAFAETAAQDAPDDTLVGALPVHAAFICLTAGGASVPGGDPVPGVDRALLDAAADRAIAVSAAYPAADPWPAELRNLLAYVLVRLDRPRDAAEQLRLTGPFVTSFPWDRDAEDPLGRFLEVRRAVRSAAADTRGPTGPRRPRSGRGGHARPGDH